MSAHGGEDHAEAAPGYESAHDEATLHHGSLKDYLTGFIAAGVLTAVPFWIVIDNVFRDPKTAATVILIFAFAQIIVHMVYFLHMNSKSEGGWTLLALMFTGIIVFITLTGSLWIMAHLNANMMPMSTSNMNRMP